MTSIFLPRYASGPVRLIRPHASDHVSPRVPLRRGDKAKTKLQRRIGRALECGETARAKGLQELYLRSFSARLCAVAETNPRLRSAERARSRELVAIASRMSAFRTSEEAVKVVPANKEGGGWRPLAIFGLERAALQSLPCSAIRPFHNPDPRQFAGPGAGHNEAARRVRQALADGQKWFVGLDIGSFYSTIEKEALAKIVPLPRRVIEHVICPPPVAAVRIGHVGRALCGARLVEASQSGISQGSRSSPLIAEIVVKGMLARFAPDVRIINLADDFGIMARSKRDAEAISTTLIRASARSPAGRFQLRPKHHTGSRRSCDGFDFLGYRFRARRSHIWVAPSERNYIRFNTRVLDFAVRMRDGDLRALAELRRYVRAWWGSFPIYDPHIVHADYFWARRQTTEVVRRHCPAALPLVRAAMEWANRDYAPLPSGQNLLRLVKPIRQRRISHRSMVPHWDLEAMPR